MYIGKIMLVQKLISLLKEWIELSSVVAESECFVLFLVNLTAQQTNEFKKSVADCHRITL